MAMNDEETVALIAGGHTFGKTHGAGDPSLVGAGAGKRRASKIRASAGRADMAAASPATRSPAARKSPGRRRQPGGATHFFKNLFDYEWELTEEPGRRATVERQERRSLDPGRFRPDEEAVPTMLTTDLALRFDPAYEKISRRFYEHPDQFADAFARAWFKLTHRDMGPKARYLGPLVPKEDLIWQDPIPAVDIR